MSDRIEVIHNVIQGTIPKSLGALGAWIVLAESVAIDGDPVFMCMIPPEIPVWRVKGMLQHALDNITDHNSEAYERGEYGPDSSED